LAGVEVATGRSLERDDLDALDAEVTQVRRGRHIGERSGEARGGEGVGVVAGSVHWDRAHSGQTSFQRGGDLDVHPRISGLGREQIGDVPPVPGGADRAVYQHGSRTNDLAWMGYELREYLGDQQAQQVPSPTHGGLADTEDRTGEGLGDVLAHQTHDQRHRAEQAQCIRAANRGEFATAGAVCTRATNSVSCSALSPVIASYRNGSSVLLSLSGRQRNKNDRGRCPSSMTRAIRRLC
jgi:hypothetical protein